MSWQRQFPAQPKSVTQARRFIGEVLPDCPTEFVESIQLMVSELATNALMHGGTGFMVQIVQQGPHLRVEVTDGGSGNPEIQSPLPTEGHGRGMQMVDALSDRWGTTRAHGEIGKTVWFSLALPATARQST
jgi:anti-sigma regulatory factor (Ser/Thr protein kinase)